MKPEELLQSLIRFNTSNPPGHEKECIGFIAQLLESHGIETTILAKDPQRPNLLARLKGKSDASPLLLYGHVDVVPAHEEDWDHPPFSGEIADGFVWGRGALDMKGAVAMMVSALIAAKTGNLELPVDVILCLVSDEEEFGEFGASFLVEEYAEYFENVRYAISEFGRFTLYVGGKKFYPIEVAQKQKCAIKATVKGKTGHGSSLVKGGAMAKLGKLLQTLDTQQCPVRVTPAVKMMFSAMAGALPVPSNFIMRQLLNPKRTDFILNLLGAKGEVFVPMFHNTVNPTVVNGGDKINVIPGELEVMMDARLLPGSTDQDVLAELREIVGEEDIELESILYDAGPAEPDMGMYDTLAQILKEADPSGIPIPLLLTASSDARFFSKLGIQTYGFIPMQLPEDMNFSRTIHSANEKIPVESLQFGTDALLEAIKRYRLQ
jgi:acetylornithine deacetylase/succinyl-diaminopimelate desuccinylase-like protein